LIEFQIFTGGELPLFSRKLMRFSFTLINYRIEVQSLPVWCYSLVSLYRDCPFRRRSQLKDLIAFFCGGRYVSHHCCYVFPSEAVALHFAFLCKAETPLISTSKEKWRFRHQIEAGYPSDPEIDPIPF
jgi:hypothetical protein